MANELRFLGGDLLFVDNKLAMADDCCCGINCCDLATTEPITEVTGGASCSGSTGSGVGLNIDENDCPTFCTLKWGNWSVPSPTWLVSVDDGPGAGVLTINVLRGLGVGSTRWRDSYNYTDITVGVPILVPYFSGVVCAAVEVTFN